MTSRERVLAVLSRQAADRVPFDLGGTDCSSVHLLTYKKLRAALHLPARPAKCGCLSQLIAALDPDVQAAFQVDAEVLAFGAVSTKMWKAPFGVEVIVPSRFNVEELPDGSSIVRNDSGKIYARRAADSMYMDPVEPPLAAITSAKEMDAFPQLFERWDYPYVYDEPIEALAARARQQYRATDRAVVALWRLHYLQSGQLMRGYGEFFMDLLADKDLAHGLLARLHEAYKKRVTLFLDQFADALDVVFLTDDLGTQEAAMISPDTYREMIFPYISEIVGLIKARGKKVVMHSCGAVSDFIPFFIEMGIDALNPVQVGAHGMNPRHLFKQYGKDMAFWGGGCDTQKVLNAPSSQLVKEDVQRRFAEFGPDAHWVFTQVHNIQYDVPAENILAMHQAYRTCAGQ